MFYLTGIIDIATETGMPISTIYRRIQNLLDAKMLIVTGTISKDGKKSFLYQSKIKEIHSAMQGSKINTKLVWMNDSEQDL
jgi:predicted transcriptional regulator